MIGHEMIQSCLKIFMEGCLGGFVKSLSLLRTFSESASISIGEHLWRVIRPNTLDERNEHIRVVGDVLRINGNRSRRVGYFCDAPSG